MKATAAMAEALYRSWWKGPETYQALSSSEKDDLIRHAQSVLDVAEMEPPQDYLDVKVSEMVCVENPGTGTKRLTVQALVPETARYHRHPGSTARALTRLMNTAGKTGISLRMYAVSEGHQKLEFNRLQSDGAPHELEGTW